MKPIGHVPEAIISAIGGLSVTCWLAGRLGRTLGAAPKVEDDATRLGFLIGSEIKRAERAWLDALSDVVAYGGHQDADGLVDSCAIGAVADAMVTLSEYGMMELDGERVGRRVLGRWTDRREEAT